MKSLKEFILEKFKFGKNKMKTNMILDIDGLEKEISNIIHNIHCEKRNNLEIIMHRLEIYNSNILLNNDPKYREININDIKNEDEILKIFEMWDNNKQMITYKKSTHPFVGTSSNQLYIGCFRFDNEDISILCIFYKYTNKPDSGEYKIFQIK